MSGGLFGGGAQQQQAQGGGGAFGGAGGLFGGGNQQQQPQGGGGGLFGGGNQQQQPQGGGGLFGGSNQQQQGAGGFGGTGGGLFGAGGGNQQQQGAGGFAGGGLFGAWGGNQQQQGAGGFGGGGGGGPFGTGGGGQQQQPGVLFGQQQQRSIFGQQPSQGNGLGGPFGQQQQQGGPGKTGPFAPQTQERTTLFNQKPQANGNNFALQAPGVGTVSQEQQQNVDQQLIVGGMAGGLSDRQPSLKQSQQAVAQPPYTVSDDVEQRYKELTLAYTNDPEKCQFKEEWDRALQKGQKDKYTDGNASTEEQDLMPMVAVGFKGYDQQLQRMADSCRDFEEKEHTLSERVKEKLAFLQDQKNRVERIYDNCLRSTSHILKVMKKIDVHLSSRTQRGHDGLEDRIFPEEEALRDRLKAVEAKLRGRRGSNSNLERNNLRARIEDLQRVRYEFNRQQHDYSREEEDPAVKKFLQQVYEHLENQIRSLEHLIQLVERDKRHTDIAEKEVRALHDHRRLGIGRRSRVALGYAELD